MKKLAFVLLLLAACSSKSLGSYITPSPASTTSPGQIQLGGDLGGTSTSQTVLSISGTNPISLTATNTSTTSSVANSALSLTSASTSVIPCIALGNTSNNHFASACTDSAGDLNFHYNNSLAAVQFYDDSGGGAGVLKLEIFNNHITGPSGVPLTISAGSGATLTRSASGGGILQDVNSGGFEFQEPAHTGTFNTQNGVHNRYSATLRITSATPATIFSVPLSSAENMSVHTWVNCRATTTAGGTTTGDMWSQSKDWAFKNVAGTVSGVGTPTALDTLNDASMSAIASSTTGSGSPIVIQLAGIASATIDCEGVADVLFN